MTQDEQQSVAESIADQLGETDPNPRRQLAAIVALCGIEFSQEILKETLKIESEGGMETRDGDRRRTPGGVFFYLSRGRMSGAHRRKIFGYQPKGKKSQPSQPSRPVFNWDERLEVLQALLESKGTVDSVKVNLIGRPGKLEKRKELVITTMEHTARNPSLPRGLPELPETPTLYTVYISDRQWRKVEEAIADPEDELVIDGLCAYDPEIEGVAVYTLSVTTKSLQRQKRDEPGQKPVKKKEMEAEAAPRKKQSSSLPVPTPPPAPIDVDIPPNMPPAIAKRLRELHVAAATYRQKLDSIMEKPEGQRFGLDITQKLLKNTEDQIATLEKKYAE